MFKCLGFGKGPKLARRNQLDTAKLVQNKTHTRGRVRAAVRAHGARPGGGGRRRAPPTVPRAAGTSVWLWVAVAGPRSKTIITKLQPSRTGYISLNRKYYFVAYKTPRDRDLGEGEGGRRVAASTRVGMRTCRLPVTRCAAAQCPACALSVHSHRAPHRSCSLNDPLKLAVPLGQRGRVGTRRARRLAPQQGTAPSARARSGGWAVASRRGRLRAAVGTCH